MSGEGRLEKATVIRKPEVEQFMDDDDVRPQGATTRQTYTGSVGSMGASGPFRPGAGGLPPYLAGREGEQRLFRELLQDLQRGVPSSSEVVLYGPRGNGKTALLFWLEREIRSLAGRVDVLDG